MLSASLGPVGGLGSGWVKVFQRRSATSIVKGEQVLTAMNDRSIAPTPQAAANLRPIPTSIFRGDLGPMAEALSILSQESVLATPQRKPVVASDASSETELIRAVQAGSRSAFDTLVRQHDQAVLRLALHLTGSEQDAQDIHQEAFLKAYRSIGNFRFECSFYTWIYRIVTNLCLDLMRRRKARREEQAVLIDATGGELDLLCNVSDDRAGANPDRELERKLLSRKIRAALDKLTPRERTVFELKHFQGLRLRTIGEMLNTTEETAKNTLFRATKKLRANLASAR